MSPRPSSVPSEKHAFGHHEHEHADDGVVHHHLDKNGELPLDDVEASRHYADIDEGFDPIQVKRILRKVDMRLIPILSAMYCISLIDRTNLSLARAANKVKMNTELDLIHGNNRYGLATIMFFIPYIILEIPSQLGLRKFGARWWLGIATVLWGVVTLAMGFINTWQGLVGLRATLGVFESCLFPGAAYLIACWYPRRNMATRNSFFYCTSIVLSGLSSILAWGISHLHGRNNMSGWRWIFIIQGLMTVFIGFMGILFIVDFPDKAKFLTEDERYIVQSRIERDRTDSHADKLTMPKFWAYMMDWKLWLFGFFFGATTTGSYSLAYFLPAILASMGFSNALAQILIAPPYVWCIVPCVCLSILSDRYRIRFAAICFNALLLIIGTAMYSQLPLRMKAARYAGIFLAIGGCNSNVPLIVAWSQSSIRQQSKRGFTSALVVAWGGIGGIFSGVAFMEKEAKMGYPTGVRLTFGLNAGVILLATGLALWMKRQNRRADRGEVILEGSPDFRYQA